MNELIAEKIIAANIAELKEESALTDL